MIRDYCLRVFAHAKAWEWGTSVVVLSLSILLVLGLTFSILRFVQPSRPRLIQDVFTAGLDGGKRSLQQARQHFTFNCAEMLLEGYEKVSLKHSIAFLRRY